MCQPTAPPSNVLAFEQPKLSGCRILIVEDEMLIALALVDIVRGLGASWVATSRVAKALALVASEPFDAAVLDMNLAGEPADAVLEALCAGGIPFIIVTGYDVGAIAEKYRGLPRLSKPFTPAQVEAALLSVVLASKSRAQSA